MKEEPMQSYRVIAIPVEVASKVRETLVSPQYGHPASVSVAKSYGPCRFCLRTFQIGSDSRILFTYNPFEGLDSYPAPGPIFVHHDSCEAFATEQAFPETLRNLPLTFEGYGDDRWIVARERASGQEIEPAIERVLAHPMVRYVHIRNTEAGCFIARIERVAIQDAGSRMQD
jgi:Protein of unknown function (DUF1203)